jgi:dipeptidyl aminopeptidase/acylaminoacyl peptidase
VDAVEGFDSPICYLAFSADGNTMAVGGREIILLRTGTAEELRHFTVKEESLVCAAISPSGKILAGGGVSIHLWNLPEGKEVPKFDGFDGGISSLAFSPDGALLVSGTDGARIRVSETATGKEIHRFQKPFKRRIPFGHDEPDAVYCVAFSPDGKTVAAGSWEYAVRLWDMSSGKEVRRLKSWDLPITSIAFTPDGKLLAVAGWDGIVRLWELLTGQEIHRFTGHIGEITSIAISPDGRLLASGSKDTSVLVWDLGGREDLPKGSPSAKEMEGLWEALGQDATKAYLASRRLVAAPQKTVVLLQERVWHTPLVDHDKLTRLINDLDSNDFQVREKASVELAELTELAEPDLQKVLKGKPSLEMRRRIEDLLKKLQDTPSSSRLRVSRSIRILELINTSEAKQLLQSFAERGSETQLTKEAKLALARLGRQKASER